MKIGFDGKATYGTAGGNPATAITKVRDVTVEISGGSSESTDRESTWRDRLPTLREWSATMTLSRDGTAVSHQALLTNLLAKTLTAFKFLDATGGKGIYGDMYITGWKVAQPLEDSDTLEITLVGADEPTLVD